MDTGSGAQLKLSVRHLVEFVFRGGDLDSRTLSNDRAMEGTRGHQRIQRSYGPEDEAEVLLKHTVDLEAVSLEVKGRADGILHEEAGVVIDEIKTVTLPLEQLDVYGNPVHWGQAKVYGYIYSLQQGLEEVTIQLTYYHLPTEEIRRGRLIFSFTQLQEFFDDLVHRYLYWGTAMLEWEEIRNASIQQLTFPFATYRRGQRNLAVGIYKTIQEGKKLYAKAPTGIGKTISALFPGIKALGEGHATKLFYLTAKTITRTVAAETLKKLEEQGLRLRRLVITAKDKICFTPGAKCTPEECIYAKGFYDRLNAGLEDLLKHEEDYSREAIEAYAQKHTLCPFEFSLEVSLWSDCIICDYNYVFDPRVYLKRFFYEGKEPFVFLIDEAHNLVDRGREMFSAELSKQAFLEAKKLLKEKHPTMAKRAQGVNQQMLKLKRLLEDEDILVRQEAPEELYPSLKSFVETAEEWLKEQEGSPEVEPLMELYFNALNFLRMAELYDKRYVTLMKQQGRDFQVKLYCIDPSYLLRAAVNRGKAAVFFSATLSPLSFYKSLLGGEEGDYAMVLDSPFEEKNLLVMIAPQISTRYRHREGSYGTIAQYIHQAVKVRKGNYLAFFPSYQFMEAVYQEWMQLEVNMDIAIIKQSTGMSEADREGFLDAFSTERRDSLLGFAVLGGIFSEGVDLPGDQLIGSIIVGVGLPQVSPEVDVIRDYFQQENGQGYRYAYQYPGMNRVLQGAGRVIRRASDRGFILLIDSRYRDGDYQQLFPREWRHYQLVRSPREVGVRLEEFWSQGESPWKK